ncbi:putative holin [Pseudomonas sp. NPDC086251]|uniref:putative holin n=1 Tax=Pseudomonas sp. NPDC086251 TaxID=3364431 RepID=UPI0038330D29
MAELNSAAAIGASAVTGLGLAAFPGIDVGAVVGGFAGALFFVVFAGDKSFKASMGYLMSSWIAGYFFAVEITSRGLAINSGLSALAGSMVFVIAATGFLEWMRGGQPPFWFRFIPGFKGKKDD